MSHHRRKEGASNARGERTRAKILGTCRELMLAGDLRPTMTALVAATGIERHAMHYHGTMAELRAAALDLDTCAKLYARIVDLPIDVFIRAVVSGKLP